ncbi:MAG: hypothetical protein HOJ57_39045 [Lentisphaerae bacterium]|jgi:hypothetical protein|nr:hypothetical protein [Lentisphaerota bacterium]MBT4819853.1 hypothetical protein [Lentisphaerota bacterium]MBT5612002.1 hypothetical protein [Lentisphaerota bacterium]MBT7061288.1 hypothetical protein [Lentisphaerota bacterium]
MSTEPIEHRVERFGELQGVGSIDFDVLICGPEMLSDDADKSLPWLPNPAEANRVLWADFFGPAYAYRCVPWSNCRDARPGFVVENVPAKPIPSPAPPVPLPHFRTEAEQLRAVYARIAAGDAVLLQAESKPLAGLWFVAAFLGGAVSYSRHHLNEDTWRDDTLFACFSCPGFSPVEHRRWELCDEEAEPYTCHSQDEQEHWDHLGRFFYYGDQQWPVYCSSSPFPVSVESGLPVKGCRVVQRGYVRDVVTWHRKFSTEGTAWQRFPVYYDHQGPWPPPIPPYDPDDPAQMPIPARKIHLPSLLWERKHLDSAFAPAENFQILATLGPNKPICFAQRIGKGAVVVCPSALRESVLDFVRNVWLSAQSESHQAVPFWDCLAAGPPPVAGAGSPASGAEGAGTDNTTAAARSFEVKRALTISITSRKRFSVQLEPRGEKFHIPMERVFGKTWRERALRSSPTARTKLFWEVVEQALNNRADTAKRMWWVVKEGEEYASLKTSCSDLKSGIEDWFKDEKGLLLQGLPSVIAAKHSSDGGGRFRANFELGEFADRTLDEFVNGLERDLS